MYKTPRKPKKWLFPAAHAREYEQRLQQAVADMMAEIEMLICLRIDDDEWYSDWNRGLTEFANRSASIFERIFDFIRKIAKKVSHFNGIQFHAVVKSAYGGDFVKAEPWLPDALDGWINTNTALIKSIPADYINRLQNLIAQAAVNGTSQAELIKQIRQTYKLPHDRARLIANDQIGKLNGQLTRRRQQSIGVEKYRWRGTLDERERDSHLRREGRIFSWSEPPSGGHPGSEINCRCWAEPIFPELEELDALLFGDGGDNRHYHAEMTRRGLKPEAGMPDLPTDPKQHYGYK